LPLHQHGRFHALLPRIVIAIRTTSTSAERMGKITVISPTTAIAAIAATATAATVGIIAGAVPPNPIATAIIVIGDDLLL
jgi:hypothetical protein